MAFDSLLVDDTSSSFPKPPANKPSSDPFAVKARMPLAEFEKTRPVESPDAVREIMPLEDFKNVQQAKKLAAEEPGRAVGGPGFFPGIKELGRGVARGVAKTVPEMAGQTLQFFDRPGGSDTLRDIGAEWRENAEARIEEYPWLKPSAYGEVKKAQDPFSVAGSTGEAGEMLVPSMGPAVAGAGIGAALGSVIPGAGTAAGAALGFGAGMLSSLPMYFGSAAQDTYERGIEQGLPEEEAREAGIWTGGIEAGGELIFDLVTMRLARLFPRALKDGLIKSATKALRNPKELVKDLASIVAVETGTEVAQSAGQQKVETEYGIIPGTDWEAVKGVVVPTAIMSLMTFGMGETVGSLNRRAVNKALSDPNADPARREAAVKQVGAELKSMDPELAEYWDKFAGRQVAAGKPVTIDADPFYEEQEQLFAQKQAEEQQRARDVEVTEMAQRSAPGAPGFVGPLGRAAEAERAVRQAEEEILGFAAPDEEVVAAPPPEGPGEVAGIPYEGIPSEEMRARVQDRAEPDLSGYEVAEVDGEAPSDIQELRGVELFEKPTTEGIEVSEVAEDELPSIEAAPAPKEMEAKAPEQAPVEQQAEQEPTVEQPPTEPALEAEQKVEALPPPPAKAEGVTEKPAPEASIAEQQEELPEVEGKTPEAEALPPPPIPEKKEEPRLTGEKSTAVAYGTTKSPTKDGGSEFALGDIEGEKVEFPGFEEFNFILHRPYTKDKKGNYVPTESGWAVTEASSGSLVSEQAVGKREESKEQAVSRVLERLRNAGTQKIRDAIQASLKGTGRQKDAEQIAEATQPDGDVQQPGRTQEGQGEMPTAEGGERVPEGGQVAGVPETTPVAEEGRSWQSLYPAGVDAKEVRNALDYVEEGERIRAENEEGVVLEGGQGDIARIRRDDGTETTVNIRDAEVLRADLSEETKEAPPQDSKKFVSDFEANMPAEAQGLTEEGKAELANVAYAVTNKGNVVPTGEGWRGDVAKGFMDGMKGVEKPESRSNEYELAYSLGKKADAKKLTKEAGSKEVEPPAVTVSPKTRSEYPFIGRGDIVDSFPDKNRRYRIGDSQKIGDEWFTQIEEVARRELVLKDGKPDYKWVVHERPRLLNSWSRENLEKRLGVMPRIDQGVSAISEPVTKTKETTERRKTAIEHNKLAFGFAPYRITVKGTKYNDHELRTFLKGEGFKWNKAKKQWYKPAENAAERAETRAKLADWLIEKKRVPLTLLPEYPQGAKPIGPAVGSLNFATRDQIHETPDGRRFEIKPSREYGDTGAPDITWAPEDKSLWEEQDWLTGEERRDFEKKQGAEKAQRQLAANTRDQVLQDSNNAFKTGDDGRIDDVLRALNKGGDTAADTRIREILVKDIQAAIKQAKSDKTPFLKEELSNLLKDGGLNPAYWPDAMIGAIKAEVVKQGTKAEKTAEGRKAGLPEGWWLNDVRELRERLEQGSMVVVADEALGLPTIHDFADAKHIGYGVFRVVTPDYTLSFSGGGAMSRLPSGQAYDLLQVSNGEFGYDFDAAKAKLDEYLGTKKKEKPAEKEAPKRKKKTIEQQTDIQSEIQNLSGADIDNLFDDISNELAEGQHDTRHTEEQERKAEEAVTEEAPADLPKAPTEEISDHAYSIARFSRKLLDEIVSRISTGGKRFTNKEIYALADQHFGGTQAQGAYVAKDAYEAVEIAVQRFIFQNLQKGADRSAWDALFNFVVQPLENLLPTQTRRTTEQQDFQQFSTPPALSMIAAYAANIQPTDTMLEPSAGTGMLAIYGKILARSVVVNELAESRRGLLRAFGYQDVYGENAEHIDAVLPGVTPTVVVMNPPFSQTAGRMAGKMDTTIGRTHVERALAKLADGGRLVAIVGGGRDGTGGMTMGAKSHKDWWAKIQKKYNVRANLGVGGDVYSRFGTTFGTRILVIDKTGPTTGEVRTTWRGEEGVLTREDLSSATALLEDLRNERVGAGQQYSAKPGSERDTGVVGDESVAGTPVSRTGDATVRTKDGGGRRRASEAGTPGDVGGRRPSRKTETEGRGRTEPEGGTTPTPEEPAEGARISGGSAVGESAQPRVTTSDAAKALAQHGIKASQETLDGLTALFGGGPATFKSFPGGFNEETYKQAKPHFERALQEAIAAGQSLRDLVKGLVLAYGEVIKPYVKQFFLEVQERERNQASKPAEQPDPSTNVEPGVTVPTVTNEAEEPFEDGLYSSYKPAVKVTGAKPHPAHIVESAAMSAVDLPNVTYKPDLPREMIESGNISDVQLEAVSAAGQSMSRMLPAEEDGVPKRAGFVIGDGTGLGKGREISAIIMDNMRRGRKKAVWISMNGDLLKDAVRDWTNIGGNRQDIFSIGKRGKDEKGYTLTEAIPTDKDGIAFTTYGMLPMKSKKGNVDANRLDQLVDWLGKDFDGVIAFDEAHAMQNALASTGGRGAKQASVRATVGKELRDHLPNARILYVTATAATEPNSLGYFDRLGLWGRGTPFNTAQQFVSEIRKGGVAAMELVARDLKAMGLMLSRSISYAGVGYNTLIHDVNPEQARAYNTAADMWKQARVEVLAAADESGANRDRENRHNMSQFWGEQQRFFNQLLTSFQMPTVLAEMRKDIKAGRSPIIQFTNTNEAEQDRQLDRIQDNEITADDFEISPKQMLVNAINRSFPVARREEYIDDEGNTRVRVVKDAEGNIVQDPELVERRDALISEVAGMSGMPENPVDYLLSQEFETESGEIKQGYDLFAEVTGRKQRMERTQGRVNKVRRGVKVREAEVNDFMDDQRQGLLFSQAGGTGASYHADNQRKNTRPRVHYIIQPGWRADTLVQGLGRSHRSNQAQPPFYQLVGTNISAHKRFLSTAARRLNQLGALSKGQRQTGGGGLFSEDFNLENEYAEDSLRDLARDIYNGNIEGWSLERFEDETGLSIQDSEGNFSDSQLEVKRFLNRLLSMRIGMMDELFGRFIEGMHDNIAAAKESGQYDAGMEITTADSIRKKQERVVRVHEETGAETKYIQAEMTEPVEFIEFSDIIERMSADVSRFRGFWHNKRSGNIAAMFYSRERTDDMGNVAPVWHRIGIMSHLKSQITETEVQNKRGHWEEITDTGEFRKMWDKAIAEHPKTRTWTEDFIVGSVLPIWDRLSGTGQIRVKRFQTNDGENVLGRFITSGSIGGVLERLGVQDQAGQTAPEVVVPDILQNDGRYQLTNQWVLRPSTVGGEMRIEIQGPSNVDERGLTGDGVYTEVINAKKRFFIPTDRAVEILTAISKSGNRDIWKKIGGGEQRGRFSASEKIGKPPREGISPVFLQARMDAMTKRWRGIDRVRVLEGEHELPSEILAELMQRKEQQPGFYARGAFGEDGTVYLIAENIASVREAMKVFMHEVVGHQGVHTLFGEALDPLLEEVAASFPQEVASIAKRYGYDLEYTEDRLAAAGEYIAKLAETHQNPGLLKRIYAAIRKFLRSIGVPLKLSNVEIDEILVASRRRMETGPRPIVESSGFQFAAGPVHSQIAAAAIDRAEDFFKKGNNVNKWFKTVGTPRGLAKQFPEQFGPVYDAATRFMDDVSLFAIQAEDAAPDLFLKQESLKETTESAVRVSKARGWGGRKLKPVSNALFTGTLDNVRYSPSLLQKKFGMDQKQIDIYDQALTAAHKSLDDLAQTTMGVQARKTLEGLLSWMDRKKLRQITKQKIEEAMDEDVLRAADNFSELFKPLLDDANVNLRIAQKAVQDATKELKAARKAKDKTRIKQAQDALNGAKTKAKEWGATVQRIVDTNLTIDKIAEHTQRLKDQGYFPLMRFGEYTLLGKDKDKNVVFFGRYESSIERNKAAREMAGIMPDASFEKGVFSEERYRLFQGVDPNALELFGEYLDIPEESKPLLKEYIRHAIADRSAMKRMLQRKGTPGFSRDVQRVLASFVVSNARLSAANLHMGDMTRAINDISPTMGDVKDAGVKLRDYLQVPQEEFSGVRQFLFFQFLGFSIASAFTNLTQVPMVTVPYLTQFAGATKASKYVMRSYAETLRGGEPKDAELKRAIQRAKDEGVVSPQEIYNLMATARGGTLGAGRVMQSAPVKVGLHVWGAFFGLAEQLNRLVTFRAAFEFAKEQGAGDPYAFAKEAVNETQFVYRKENRPPWARGITAPIFTFKQFTINYLEFLARLPAKERAFAIGMLVLAAGITGLPFEEDLEDLIDTIMQWSGNPWQTREELEKFAHDALDGIFGEMATNVALKGVSELGLPFDMHARLSLNNIVPATGALKPGTKDDAREISEALGAGGQVIRNIGRAGEQLVKGDYASAAYLVAPRAIQAMWKGIESAQSGYYQDIEGRRIAPVTGQESVAKFLGFHPKMVARQQDKQWRFQEKEDYRSLKEDALADRWAEAAFHRDRLKILEVRQELVDWNRNNPDTPIRINPGQIRSRIRNMRMLAGQRFLKRISPEMRAQAAQVVDFY